jgi:PAS domain-containing protein
MRDARRLPRLLPIPSDDLAFAGFVRDIASRDPLLRPEDLQERLARLFPRVAVRARDLSGEPPSWYVYRDGRWRPPTDPRWWRRPDVPALRFDADGWLEHANPGARGLLAIQDGDHHHYSDFVAPGAGGDSAELFRIVRDGQALEATLLLRPMDGGLIACELHAEAAEGGAAAWLRLAEDVTPPQRITFVAPRLRCEPASDAVFARWAERALARLPDADPDALTLRLRRLYPHATLETAEDGWIARRDGPEGEPRPAWSAGPAWWTQPQVARVRYDGQGLIVDANEAASALLGSVLVGRHWQELVVPGTHDDVAEVIDLIRDTGEVLSRFRMPGPGGDLVEFDSWTRGDGDRFETRMRPVPSSRTGPGSSA